MRAALWVRVSTEEQDTANQLAPLRAEAERRGDETVKVHDLEASAYNGRHQGALAQLQADVRARHVQVVYVWSLDRLSREGIAATLRALDPIYRAGGKVVSLQESWLDSAEDPQMRELLIAITGWVAGFESRRRSERTKAGLAKRRAQGYRLGRPPGSKDQITRQRRSRLR